MTLAAARHARAGWLAAVQGEGCTAVSSVNVDRSQGPARADEDEGLSPWHALSGPRRGVVGLVLGCAGGQVLALWSTGGTPDLAWADTWDVAGAWEP